MGEELRFAMRCRASRKRPALRRKCSKCYTHGVSGHHNGHRGVSPSNGYAIASTYVPAGSNSLDMIPQTGLSPIPPVIHYQDTYKSSKHHSSNHKGRSMNRLDNRASSGLGGFVPMLDLRNDLMDSSPTHHHHSHSHLPSHHNPNNISFSTTTAESSNCSPSHTIMNHSPTPMMSSSAAVKTSALLRSHHRRPSGGNILLSRHESIRGNASDTDDNTDNIESSHRQPMVDTLSSSLTHLSQRQGRQQQSILTSSQQNQQQQLAPPSYTQCHLHTNQS
jgi:hypothetical protein